jgi:hypothetical protein
MCLVFRRRILWIGAGKLHPAIKNNGRGRDRRRGRSAGVQCKYTFTILYFCVCSLPPRPRLLRLCLTCAVFLLLLLLLSFFPLRSRSPGKQILHVAPHATILSGDNYGNGESDENSESFATLFALCEFLDNSMQGPCASSAITALIVFNVLF